MVQSPKFVFGQVEDGVAPNKILGIAPADAYFVSYTDKEGKKAWRLVFHIPNEEASKDEILIVQEMVQGKNLIATAQDWFKNSVSQRIRRFLDMRNAGANSDSEDGVPGL